MNRDEITKHLDQTLASGIDDGPPVQFASPLDRERAITALAVAEEMCGIEPAADEGFALTWGGEDQYADEVEPDDIRVLADAIAFLTSAGIRVLYRISAASQDYPFTSTCPVRSGSPSWTRRDPGRGKARNPQLEHAHRSAAQGMALTEFRQLCRFFVTLRVRGCPEVVDISKRRVTESGACFAGYYWSGRRARLLGWRSRKSRSAEHGYSWPGPTPAVNLLTAACAYHGLAATRPS